MDAIEIAHRLYTEAGRDFKTVMADHLANGMVISSPAWLILLKAVELPEGHAWFVECAVGNLKALGIAGALLNELTELPLVAFCRIKGGKKTMRTYPTSRLIAHAKGEA